ASYRIASRSESEQHIVRYFAIRAEREISNTKQAIVPGISLHAVVERLARRPDSETKVVWGFSATYFCRWIRHAIGAHIFAARKVAHWLSWYPTTGVADCVVA